MFCDTYVYDDGDVFYVWENELSEDGRVNIEINFFVRDRDKYIRITEDQTQYIHEIEEITSLLKKAGFENIEIFDDYTEEGYGEKSLRAVFTAMKL
jgi:biopolymer transport protein ExbD